MIKLADYLVQREDVDPVRIGITGESLGGALVDQAYINLRTIKYFRAYVDLAVGAGMHAWFAAAADERYSVVVPIIGVQVLM